MNTLTSDDKSALLALLELATTPSQSRRWLTLDCSSMSTGPVCANVWERAPEPECVRSVVRRLLHTGQHHYREGSFVAALLAVRDAINTEASA